MKELVVIVVGLALILAVALAPGMRQSTEPPKGTLTPTGASR